MSRFVRAKRRSVMGLASAYRAMSFSSLAGIAGLGVNEFANKINVPDRGVLESNNTSHNADRAGLARGLDQTTDAQDSSQSNAGPTEERQLQVDDAAAARPQLDASQSENSHKLPQTIVGSSTAPQLIAEPLPTKSEITTTGAATPPTFGFDIKVSSGTTSGVMPNQVGVLLVAQIGTTAPQPNATTVISVAASGPGIDGSGNGDLNAGHVVTLTVAMSEVVTVAGGIPTLSLNNGGTASFTGGSGSNALTFSYTVGAGQDTSDLAVTSFNLNGATVSDPAGNNAIVTGAVTNPAGLLQIDTTAPTVPSVAASGPGIDGSGNGDLNAGHVVTLTVAMSEVVTVAGGIPTLSLNNGGTASFTGGSGSNALTFSYTVGAGQDTSDLAVTSFNLNGATVSDPAGNNAIVTGAVTNPAGLLQIDTTAPTVPSVAVSGPGIDGSGNGDLNAGHVVTLTVAMSEVVTVAGGIPTLSLNNGGTASFTGGSGSNALTFSYTVGAGQDTSDLAVTSFNLNGATVSDPAGNNAIVAGAVTNPAGILQIDTTAPTVPSVAASGPGIDGSGNGDLNAGHVVTLTVAMSEVVTVAGGIPTLSLNNGGTASFTGGSGSNALTFSYTVGAGQDTSDLAVTSFNLNGATVSDPAGNSAIVTGAVTNPAGILQIDTTAPTVPSVVVSGPGIDGSGNGDLNAGHVVTLTVAMSEVVTVAGGVPTLSLNNGGTASFTGGSGSNALTFSYTVGAGQDTSDLAVTSFNLNGATVSDPAGNNAIVTGAVTNPAGILQIDTTAPTVPSVAASGPGIDGSGNGDLNAGHVVTLTVAMSEVVTVAGGVPTLSLNNGGTASFTGGSGSNALTFSYTVGAGQDTSDLAVTSFNLNGATVSDPAGNSAIVTGAVTNPAGILQIDTTAPTVPSVVVSGPGIDGSGNGDLNAGHVVTLTVAMSEVVTVAGGVPTLSLNNGGTASFTGGSGSNALTFSYTVGAGQDTGDLAVTSFNLNGATVSDPAGNNAIVTGAVTNPAGILQIDTTAPTVPSVAVSGPGIDGSGNGDLNAGHVVTLTVAMSEVVTVAGGVPTLSLNNGGTASFTGGSGSNALTFSYTVGAGQDTSDLAVTSFNLNGATVSDPAGNNAIVTGAVTNPAGILQIDTTAPTVPSISVLRLGGGGGNHWVFNGTAEANSNVAIFDGNTQLSHGDGFRLRCVELHHHRIGNEFHHSQLYRNCL